MTGLCLLVAFTARLKRHSLSHPTRWMLIIFQ